MNNLLNWYITNRLFIPYSFAYVRNTCTSRFVLLFDIIYAFLSSIERLNVYKKKKKNTFVGTRRSIFFYFSFIVLSFSLFLFFEHPTVTQNQSQMKNAIFRLLVQEKLYVETVMQSFSWSAGKKSSKKL